MTVTLINFVNKSYLLEFWMLRVCYTLPVFDNRAIVSVTVSVVIIRSVLFPSSDWNALKWKLCRLHQLKSLPQDCLPMLLKNQFEKYKNDISTVHLVATDVLPLFAINIQIYTSCWNVHAENWVKAILIMLRGKTSRCAESQFYWEKLLNLLQRAVSK